MRMLFTLNEDVIYRVGTSHVIKKVRKYWHETNVIISKKVVVGDNT